MTPTPTGNPATDMMLDVHAFCGELEGKPVMILDETINPDKHTVVVKGDFGNEWTHGGFAPKTKMVVAISRLNNVMAYLSNGQVIEAKGK